MFYAHIKLNVVNHVAGNEFLAIFKICPGPSCLVLPYEDISFQIEFIALYKNSYG